MTSIQSTQHDTNTQTLSAHTPRWREFLRRILRSKGALIGFSISLFLIVVALLAAVISPFDPVKVNVGGFMDPPGGQFLLGTDQFGRDIFSRIIFGSRVSLTVGFISVGIASIIGVTIGLVGGYYGGWIDDVLMRLIDIMLAFPGILLALVIVSILGPSLTNLMIAVGISAIPGYARLTRGSVLSAREHLYVEAARSVGVSNPRILVRHILPNVVAPVIVAATLGIGTAILWAAALSFLGLGSQPPEAEWGRMLSEGRRYLRDQWWISTFPGLAIMITVLGVNMLGDGLRDAIDPRLKE
jgi:peptide/nickel transport system permease protein